MAQVPANDPQLLFPSIGQVPRDYRFYNGVDAEMG